MLFPDAQPSPAWTQSWVSGSSPARGFSIMLPPGWELRELQGVDSLVGKVVGNGVRLMYDYGDFSWDPDDAGPAGSHTVFNEVIGGLEGKMLVPTFGSNGTTGVYFESLEGTRFNLVGENLTPEQQRMAVAVFRGIRGLKR